MIKKLSDRQIDRLAPDLLEEVVGYFLGWTVKFDPNCDSGGLEFPEVIGYSEAFPPNSKTRTGACPGRSELHEFDVVPMYSRESEHNDELIHGLIQKGWTEITYEYFTKGKKNKKIRSVHVMVESNIETSPLKSNYKWARGEGPTKEVALCRAIARAFRWDSQI